MGLKRTKDYLWLETSWVYELWCFQQVYQLFVQELGYEENGYMTSGFIVTKDTTTIKLHYDTVIPIHKKETNQQTCPLYARSPLHRRPDGRIDVYKNNQYYGSLILEFKYSSYYNVWNEKRETWCSEQLLHYGYQLASIHLVNQYCLPEQIHHQMNPVQGVLVIMPRLRGNMDLEKDSETHIVQVGLMPGEVNNALKTYISEIIER